MISLLHKKILLGYVIILSIIFSVIVIVMNERLCFQKFVSTIVETNITRDIIYKAHLNITKLTTLGESVIVWDSSDFDRYHRQLLKTDSILLKVEYNIGNLVDLSQIDSLRLLLATKEMYLYRIMRIIQSGEKADSLLLNHLLIDNQSARVKTITRKKKGIAGLLGKKEIVQIPYDFSEIKEFNKKIISTRNLLNSELEISVDSLRLHNRVLNHKLYEFISLLDNQIQKSLAQYDLETVGTGQESFNSFVFVIVIVGILLVIAFFIIQFNLQKEEKIKLKLRKIIQENEELLEMREKIILTVSHDIRGPLGNIHNCADLASETREKKKREIYLQDIRYSCNHIFHLVNDLMDAYRINESGELRNDTPFYLDSFLRRISDDFLRKANTKGLIFYPVHEKSSLTVKGDVDKLEQVLANLLTNAIKFTPSGSVRFHSQYLESKLRIEIVDTGIGMDSETLKRVFSPFERAAQNINSEGFGLGLFLTKGLIKVLDGIMDVESEPGKGTIFRLEFPLPVTDEPVEQDKSDNYLINSLPEKVLVVDDDPIQLKIAEDMLGRNGITCNTCINIREVMAAFEQSNYDVVLTDLQMPGIDGFGLLKLLRNSDIGNSRTVPVAVMTARGDGNTGIYEKEGFVGCIHKPFNIRSLLAFLSSTISKDVHSGHMKFDFTRLLESTEDREYILSLVVSESKRELEELEFAVKTTNRENMRKTVHRMISVWEMLGKDCLLREFQKVLHDNNCSDETVCEYAFRIMECIVKLVEETEKELKKI